MWKTNCKTDAHENVDTVWLREGYFYTVHTHSAVTTAHCSWIYKNTVQEIQGMALNHQVISKEIKKMKQRKSIN